MKKTKVWLGTVVLLAMSFGAAEGCGSIPDHAKTRPGSSTGGGGAGPDGGGMGGSSAASGTSSGGGSGASGASGAGGSGAAATGGHSGTGGVAPGSGGASGSGGAFGSGGVAASGGGDGGPAEVTCGTTVCKAITNGAKTIPPCCTSGNKCGANIDLGTGASVCIEPAGTGDLTNDCPGFVVGSTPFYGCCPASGTCGLSLGTGSLGCISATAVGDSNVQNCKPATTDSCKAGGATCTASTDCCSLPKGSTCAQLSSSPNTICTAYCTTNAECASGCCVWLLDGNGACADASECTKACPDTDIRTCDSDADCCTGTVCVTQNYNGPNICRPTCAKNSDCSTGDFCVKDATSGKSACSAAGVGLCTNTCAGWTNDGSCSDGGPNSDGFNDCTYGTDCTDCGPRVNGIDICVDSCATANNGKCEDGGTGSKAGTCEFGTDCSDCGDRLGICSDDCGSTDGDCEDGGPNSDADFCTPGTDCTDCGIRFMGRGGAPCDGTTGAVCLSSDPWDYANDTYCDCTDCKWDVADCGAQTNKCNGSAVSTCCAAGNPCKLQPDGICECGDWCAWDTADCGN